jgi:GT2 family glycosyltransferase
VTPSNGTSVLVRTIGRPELLRSCLASIMRCDPPPDEIVVVDQSRGEATSHVVSEFVDRGARVVPCPERGTSLAFNVGLRAVAHETVLVTDDDCTVAPDWIAEGRTQLDRDRGAIVTGRVLPVGDVEAVPSTIDDPEPHDYTGEYRYNALYTNNMVCSRSELVAFGGFDERFRVTGEDNDLCYRWLKAGRTLRYEPSLVVWHHDWRSPRELERLYVQYGVADGMLYAKLLLQRDWRAARQLRRHLREGFRGLGARVVRGRARASDWRQGILRGLPIGLVKGLVVFRAEARRRG